MKTYIYPDFASYSVHRTRKKKQGRDIHAHMAGSVDLEFNKNT